MSEPTVRSLFETRWFRIPSGEHEGRWHLSGWMKTALNVLDASSQPMYIAVSICPRCRAVVFADEDLRRNAYGNCEWAHEQWHARTDFPIPDGSE